MKKFFTYFLLLSLFGCQFAFAAPLKVAITIDDLPVHGELPPGVSRTEVVNRMLATLEKHHIKEVYGLINGSNALDNEDNRTALQRWVNGGQLLGNHSYSHLDLDKTSPETYIKNIQENEPLLKRLMSEKDFRFFRYPYLAEGNTQQKRDRVRQFLLSHQYKIAQVTTDFSDFEWNAPYIRCLRARDENAIKWLKQSFIEQALNALTISHVLSQKLFGREIKNVLLLHVGVFDALMLDELLSAYEKQGVQFIPLSEALSDDVYTINPNVVRNRTYTFLNQVRLARGFSNPKIVEDLYKTLPEEKLNKLCR